MLTMAAPSGTGGTPAAVTDGGGGADMRRASNRYARQTGRPISSLMPYRKIIMSAGARSGTGRGDRSSRFVVLKAVRSYEPDLAR
jgi:hypothetical protein